LVRLSREQNDVFVGNPGLVYVHWDGAGMSWLRTLRPFVVPERKTSPQAAVS